MEDFNQTITFTKEELEAIEEGLQELLLKGYADNDADPIVTALVKVNPKTPKQFEET